MTMVEQAQQTISDVAQRAKRVMRQRPDKRHTNVGEDERVLSVAAGTLIATLGLSRMSWPGLLVAGLGGALVYRGLSGQCPVYSALEVDTSQTAAESGVRVAQSFTIDKPREELYRYWRNFENLPTIMSHLKKVEVKEGDRSRWVAKAPAIVGGEVEWEAEITEDVENERIAWRSLPGSDVDNVGSVAFEESPRGTIVRVELCYITPAGSVGRWVAKLLGQSPERQVREDLRKFKRIMETGEALTVEGQPRGTCFALQR